MCALVRTLGLVSIAVAFLVACDTEGTGQTTTAAMPWFEGTGTAVGEVTMAATSTPTLSEVPAAPATAGQTMTRAPAATPAVSGTATGSPAVTGIPGRTATSISVPTRSETQTPEPSESPTPTRGPVVTRTPLPPGLCPERAEEVPPISAIEVGVGIVDGFEPQLRDYLSAGGNADVLRATLNELALVDGEGAAWQARAQVVSVDVTGNGTPEVVVGLTFLVEGQYADGGLFVFSCQEGQYAGGAVRTWSGQAFAGGSPDPGIRAIQDMNRDGVPEIVYSYVQVIGTHANFTRLFHVLEWNGSEFLDLIQSDFSPSTAAPVENGDGAILDTNGNKNLELLLTNGVGFYYEDGGPQRGRLDTWAWDGYSFRLAQSEDELPVYRFQAVQDGDVAAAVGRYQRALALYEQAIVDDQLLGWSQGQLWPDTAYGNSPTPTPDPAERTRLTAYATYRTLLVHVLTGATEEARELYQSLQEQFPEGTAGHPYARLGTAFWQTWEATRDTTAACDRAVAVAAAHAEETLGPLGSRFYGSQNRDYGPKDVCPY
jgi:hypothetical protein